MDTSRSSRRTRPLGLLLAALLAGALAAAPAPAHADPDPSLDLDPVTMTVTPPSAGWAFTSSGNRTLEHQVSALGLWRDGVASARFVVPADWFPRYAAFLSLEVGADRCDGGADLTVRLDGVPVLHRVVQGDREGLGVPSLTAGAHLLTLAYSGDHVTTACDRSLKVFHARVLALYLDSPTGPPPPAPVPVHPAADLVFGPPSLQYSDPRAGFWHDRRDTPGVLSAEALVWSTASLGLQVTTAWPGQLRVNVVAGGDRCEGWPRMQVLVDGVDAGTVDVDWPRAVPYSFEFPDLPVAAGLHQVRVAFLNDHRTATCDRNLGVQRVEVRDEPDQ